MLTQRLQQKLLQKLSPQQIQMIKLLEIPTLELEQRIKEELEVNPTLEEGAEKDPDEEPDVAAHEEEDFSIDAYLTPDDIPSYKLASPGAQLSDAKTDIPFSVGQTFHDFLETQLGFRRFTERERTLAEYIIGNIDDAGYLRRPLESIVDDLAFRQGLTVEEAELEAILSIIQEFEPSGVGARNLQECLLIQLRAKAPSPETELAIEVVTHHFQEFGKKHYDKILTRTGSSEEALKRAINEILRLNPKPGSSFSDQHSKVSEHVTPDFLLEERDGRLVLQLNSRNIPELRVSRTYSNMMEAYSANKKGLNRNDKDALTFVKQKLDSARWFIEAIKQRQNTLMVTMQAIVNYQKAYFEQGDETKLVPMILKDIADITQMDISTVSRVVNSKYVQTPFGIFHLKSFFSEGLQTDSGEEVSTREIKKILQECIEGESKKRPLTDEKLADILKEKGYLIARRTIAKYREQLNIPVARLRKSL